MKEFLKEYRRPELVKGIAEKIAKESAGLDINLMEVCGTHTVSIFRNGIRSMLPESIKLISGPGCPVCVTSQGEVDAFVEISREKDVIVTTFGDLMRVPGSDSSLAMERASGRDVRMVYATFDAVEIARNNPSKKVVFLGVGFETTAPTSAAAILLARERGIDNFFLLCAHKLVPPALEALLESGLANIDGFILPGHVSVIIGKDAYKPVVEEFRVPSVIAGFEPVDILEAIHLLCVNIKEKRPQLINGYRRAVTDSGNTKAQKLLDGVFEACDAEWRGIGVIRKSGLRLRSGFESYDAGAHFGIKPSQAGEPPGCECGRVLTGSITPPECPLYKKACTPSSPVGPCMVSTEGTCAAYFRYNC